MSQGDAIDIVRHESPVWLITARRIGSCDVQTWFFRSQKEAEEYATHLVRGHDDVMIWSAKREGRAHYVQAVIEPTIAGMLNP